MCNVAYCVDRHAEWMVFCYVLLDWTEVVKIVPLANCFIEVMILLCVNWMVLIS